MSLDIFYMGDPQVNVYLINIYIQPAMHLINGSILTIVYSNDSMPQLVPFFFFNQVVFTFAILVFLFYVFFKYILPRMLRLFTTRLFISKL